MWNCAISNTGSKIYGTVNEVRQTWQVVCKTRRWIYIDHVHVHAYVPQNSELCWNHIISWSVISHSTCIVSFLSPSHSQGVGVWWSLTIIFISFSDSDRVSGPSDSGIAGPPVEIQVRVSWGLAPLRSESTVNDIPSGIVTIPNINE